MTTRGRCAWDTCSRFSCDVSIPVSCHDARPCTALPELLESRNVPSRNSSKECQSCSGFTASDGTAQTVEPTPRLLWPTLSVAEPELREGGVLGGEGRA